MPYRRGARAGASTLANPCGLRAMADVAGLIRAAFGVEAPAHQVRARRPSRYPPALCAGCPHRLISGLSRMKRGHGRYRMLYAWCAAALSAMDTTIDMGTSVSMSHGFELARGPVRTSSYHWPSSAIRLRIRACRRLSTVTPSKGCRHGGACSTTAPQPRLVARATRSTAKRCNIVRRASLTWKASSACRRRGCAHRRRTTQRPFAWRCVRPRAPMSCPSSCSAAPCVLIDRIKGLSTWLPTRAPRAACAPRQLPGHRHARGRRASAS